MTFWGKKEPEVQIDLSEIRKTTSALKDIARLMQKTQIEANEKLEKLREMEA